MIIYKGLLHMILVTPVGVHGVLHVFHVAGWAWHLLAGVALMVHTALLVVVVAWQQRGQAGIVSLHGSPLMWVERVLIQSTHKISQRLTRCCGSSKQNLHLLLHTCKLLLVLGVVGNKAHCSGRGEEVRHGLMCLHSLVSQICTEMDQ